MTNGQDQESLSPSGVQVVCFDLGGVLIRIRRTWTDACHAAGVEVRGDSAGEPQTSARTQLLSLFATGRLSEDEWIRRLSQVLEGRYTPDELRRIHHVRCGVEYAETGPLIDDLHQAGVLTACLSNTDPSHWRRLIHADGDRELPGQPDFPAVKRLRRHFASHLLGLEKPDPAIYRAFEQMTGLTGGQILFFDDLGDNVGAARARGWNAELVDHRSETVPQIRVVLRRYGLL